MALDLNSIFQYIPQEKIAEWLRWIEKNPTTFIYYVILILSPFLLVSAFLSWKLSKEMQKEAKEKKQKESRTKAILAAKASRTPSGKSESDAANGNTAPAHDKKHKKKKK
ncbi:small integral membrane protein 15-like [Paramacrobiotus metropolitanus]|uniref:small integral membrane protein 15-like n=1 Tax=Paramacrobiotus metropolitanus TaxID=2943436 RepID=UPI002445E0F9|nr:small integral membrane protein 15-like [Paramacrobiotus metropolitanus]